MKPGIRWSGAPVSESAQRNSFAGLGREPGGSRTLGKQSQRTARIDLRHLLGGVVLLTLIAAALVAVRQTRLIG